MEKFIKDGEVAVLYSPREGAGWSTWNQNNKEMVFDSRIVEMVLSGRQSEINSEWMKQNLNMENAIVAGAENLDIMWIKKGEPFIIKEHNGHESILLLDGNFFVA